ncbi:MAG: aldo/keto reductase [bacterium]
MIYNNFGKNEIKVSVLGFGAGEIGDLANEDKQVEAILNFALDNGINLIDTARGYFASEDRIGRFISHRRKEFVLSTKIGYGIDGENDWSYNCIIKGVEEALKLLCTDYLDIVHLHSCELGTLQHGEVITALLKTKEQGKVRCIAYSGENEALLYAVNTGVFDSVQTSLNVCDQRNINNIFPKTIEKNISVIAKRSIANAPWLYNEQPYGQYVEEYWKRFRKMGINKNFNWFETAIRFTAFTKGITCCIVGTTNIEHLKHNINYVNMGPLPKKDYTLIRDSFMNNDDHWVGQV